MLNSWTLSKAFTQHHCYERRPLSTILRYFDQILFGMVLNLFRMFSRLFSKNKFKPCHQEAKIYLIKFDSAMYPKDMANLQRFILDFDEWTGLFQQGSDFIIARLSSDLYRKFIHTFSFS